MATADPYDPFANTDGYYYRERAGKVHGPLSRTQFEALQARGVITPNLKIWRSQAGNAFKVTPKRRLIVGRVFSFTSCSHLMELMMVIFATSCLVFALTLPKMREELSESGWEVYLLLGLAAVTFVMTIFTIMKTSERLRDSSTEVFCDEV